ncbi:hypothetical protein EB061_10370 [bacterium]|nr:hypothetical protein [bacterium]
MEKEDDADRSFRTDVSILFFCHSVHWDFPGTADRLAFRKRPSRFWNPLIQPRWFIGTRAVCLLPSCRVISSGTATEGAVGLIRAASIKKTVKRKP